MNILYTLHLIYDVDNCTCVPLIITVCAGKLTPQANVAVETKTWMCLSAKRSSTSVLSTLVMPA